jgi:hypothetical protein
VWSQHANIKFSFVNSLPAEIRIGFNKGDGSWSYLGTDALRKRDDEITMNFGWFTDNSTDEEFARTTLHEFGHALGCVHEHSQPNAKFSWNKEAVYDHHKRVGGWTREQVDSQIFSHYSNKEVSATAHDTTSIMHYPIDKKWTTNGFSVGWNIRLSASDTAFIRKMYPVPRTTASTGTANTLAVRSWEQPAQSNEMIIPFDVPSTSPPSILVGLNWLDVGNNANLRVKTDVEDVANDQMRLNIRSWADTVQYSAGCAWLRVPSDDPDLQFGHFRTDEGKEGSTEPLLKASRKITFETRYDIPPAVVVWLNALDVGNETNCRVSVYATDVRRDGFALHVDTWADTKLYMAGATWMAYTSSRSDIASGTFNTNDIRSSDRPQPENSASVTFDASFEAPPRVFMALNNLDIDRSANARVRLSTEDVGPTGMSWHIDSWSDTKLYGAGASYIAMANAL